MISRLDFFVILSQNEELIYLKREYFLHPQDLKNDRKL